MKMLTRRIAVLARRLVTIVTRVALLWPLTAPNSALAQPAPYVDPYVASNRHVEVSEDPVSVLIVAESFDLAYRRQQATVLREFVERRLWLQALGEPQPAAANVGEVLDAIWPESIIALRARGAARTFEIAAGGASLEPTPSSSGSPRPGLEMTLTADIAITNRGALPVAALYLALTLPAPNGGSWLERCEEHGMDAIAPGEARVVHCSWRGTDEQMQALQRLLAAHAPANATIAIDNVSFAVAGRRIPHEPDFLRNSSSDLDARRVAIESSGARDCHTRGDCGADPEVIALALFPWLVVPCVLGIAVGRRSRRP